MIEQSLILKLSSPGLADDTTSRLRQEYQANQSLFQAQPGLVQQYLGVQAAALADAVIQGLPQAHFTLPENVVYASISDTSLNVVSVPPPRREQIIGGWLRRLTSPNLSSALCQRLLDLERSSDQALSISAMLVRYAIAVQMIYHVLPAGRSVSYAVPEEDDIPNQPMDRHSEQDSAIQGRMEGSV